MTGQLTDAHPPTVPHPFRRSPSFICALAIVAILTTGCASRPLPSGSRLVGGGLLIDWEAPADGTVLLRERITGKVVTSRSLRANGGELSRFRFDVSQPADSTALQTALEQIPTNAVFELYFVPVP